MDFQSVLHSKLLAQADTERATQMKAYLRDQFAFLGVMATPRRQAFRETFKEVGLPENAVEVAKNLFSADERELNICGQELLFRARRQWTEDSIKDFEWFITTRSWWDTVDYIASTIVGEFVRRYPSPQTSKYIKAWAASDNIWLQRTAILFQLKYRELTDTDWLSRVIEMHANQHEFFIKKAIGWALREYSKTNPKWVQDFVSSHILQALSVKEALRLIK